MITWVVFICTDRLTTCLKGKTWEITKTERYIFLDGGNKGKSGQSGGKTVKKAQFCQKTT